MDDDLRARVAHPNAPRINAKRSPEDAPSRAPSLAGERHVAPIVRALHDVRTRFNGEARTEATQRAFEYDAAEAIREYLTHQGIKTPERFSVSWLLDDAPRLVVSGCMLTVPQFAHAVDTLSG